MRGAIRAATRAATRPVAMSLLRVTARNNATKRFCFASYTPRGSRDGKLGCGWVNSTSPPPRQILTLLLTLWFCASSFYTERVPGPSEFLLAWGCRAPARLLTAKLFEPRECFPDCFNWFHLMMMFCSTCRVIFQCIR